MTVYHNWNQIHDVLLKLGYRQVSDYNDRYLYYVNDENIKVTIPKSNRIDLIIIKNILTIVGLPYDKFVAMYRDV